jgi:WD40 repeat protein
MPLAASAEGTAPAAKAGEEAVSYHRQVRPLVQRNCVGCHQPAKTLGKLLMTSYEAFAKGGLTGEPWVPGKPAESLVVWYLRGTHEKQVMPQGGPALPADQIALIERWIAQGAKDDTPEAFKKTLVAKGPPKYRAPVPVNAMAFAPDGSALAVAGYREVLIHNPEGGEIVSRLVGLSERIETVVFSPDGKLLAVAGGSAGRFGELQIWDWREKKLLRSVIPSFDTIYGASFSPDGKRVSFGCADNSARVVETATGKQVLRIDHHQDWVFGTALSLDNKHIITAGRDRALKLCESDTGSFIDNITTITPGLLGGGLRGLVRRPDKDDYLTAGEDGIPKLYKMIRTSARQIGDDANLIRNFEKLDGRVEGLCFSADGKLCAACGPGGTKVYGTDDGKTVATLPAKTTLYAVALRPDGKAVAVAGLDGLVRTYSLPDGRPIKEFVPVPLEK